MFVASAHPHKRCGSRVRVDVVDYLLSTSRLLADILFVCHPLTSPSLVVFVTPCDISCAQPVHDESRKDLSSMHCNTGSYPCS